MFVLNNDSPSSLIMIWYIYVACIYIISYFCVLIHSISCNYVKLMFNNGYAYIDLVLSCMFIPQYVKTTLNSYNSYM